MVLLFLCFHGLGGMRTEEGGSPTMGAHAKDSMSKAKSAMPTELPVVDMHWSSGIFNYEWMKLHGERDMI